ncbi:hypothetical protein Cgig2_028056 [Carnegiea gigantea]|uniref:Uncharacterized protein n=1 Tax=Carnegiea gigantea TaxID=171969 RepID=A0A9Q1Q6K0_9CARY|nr:hypothetical protein Cgig2_028056 [Carnegiea gigantea]
MSGFTLSNAKEAVRDFHIPEMVQAIFYAMVVNESLELGFLSRDLVECLKSALEGLQWFIFEAWLQLNRHALLWAYYHKQVDLRTSPEPAGDQEESSGSSGTPPPSSNDETGGRGTFLKVQLFDPIGQEKLTPGGPVSRGRDRRDALPRSAQSF